LQSCHNEGSVCAWASAAQQKISGKLKENDNHDGIGMKDESINQPKTNRDGHENERDKNPSRTQPTRL
jgi:hypothetical protein